MEAVVTVEIVVTVGVEVLPGGTGVMADEVGVRGVGDAADPGAEADLVPAAAPATADQGLVPTLAPSLAPLRETRPSPRPGPAPDPSLLSQSPVPGATPLRKEPQDQDPRASPSHLGRMALKPHR